MKTRKPNIITGVAVLFNGREVETFDNKHDAREWIKFGVYDGCSDVVYYAQEVIDDNGNCNPPVYAETRKGAISKLLREIAVHEIVSEHDFVNEIRKNVLFCDDWRVERVDGYLSLINDKSVDFISITEINKFSEIASRYGFRVYGVSFEDGHMKIDITCNRK